MKKKLLSTLAVCTALTVATAASAGTVMSDDMYVKVDAGYSIGSSDTENAGLFGLGVGFRMNDYFRTDITAEYRPWGKMDFRGYGKPDIYTLDAFWNVYASYPVWDRMSVYATGGLGYAYTDVDNKGDVLKGKHKGNFAWNVGAGIGYMLTSNVCLDLGYRYADLGEAKAKVIATGETTKKDVRYNDIKIGMQYHF